MKKIIKKGQIKSKKVSTQRTYASLKKAISIVYRNELMNKYVVFHINVYFTVSLAENRGSEKIVKMI